jgi:glutathione S-transferase/RNA polymerase-associated protein
MIVYEHPFSPYAQKVKIALREKGLAFETRIPDVVGSGMSNDLAPLNPRREVPALIDGTVTVFDSTIILEYLEDKFPTPALLPATPAARARARMIEDMCDTHYEAINWGLLELRYFKRGGAERAALDRTAVAQTHHLFAWLEAALGEQDWFGGDGFGWADLSVVPHVLTSAVMEIEPVPDSPLARWWARAQTRPSVAATRGEALATVPFMEKVLDYFVDNGFKREYRDHRLEWVIRSGGIQIVLDGMAKGDLRFTDTEAFTRHSLPPA